jgi:hypothetical protein
VSSVYRAGYRDDRLAQSAEKKACAEERARLVRSRWRAPELDAARRFDSSVLDCTLSLYSGFQEVFMAESRRHLLITVAAAAGMMAVKPVFLFGQHPPTPQPRPSPNAPDPHAPAGLDRAGVGNPDTKTLDQQNQKQIRSDIDKLFEMVSELKQEVAATDLNSTMSLNVMKKAHQIEKLAKEIKDRAKG